MKKLLLINFKFKQMIFSSCFEKLFLSNVDRQSDRNVLFSFFK